MSKSRPNTTQRDLLRAACFRVWGRSCLYCGDRASEVDHIIELASGGTHTIDNVQPLCKPCHRVKTSRFNSTRLTQPRRASFSVPSAPTDSLAQISPYLIRSDPPTTERPKS